MACAGGKLWWKTSLTSRDEVPHNVFSVNISVFFADSLGVFSGKAVTSNLAQKKTHRRNIFRREIPFKF